MKTDLSRITVDIPKADHKKLKAKAAILGKSMKEIILEGINTVLCNNIPNIETRKAIREVKERKGLIESESLEDLFKELGI